MLMSHTKIASADSDEPANRKFICETNGFELAVLQIAPSRQVVGACTDTMAPLFELFKQFLRGRRSRAQTSKLRRIIVDAL